MTESLFFIGIVPPEDLQNIVTDLKNWVATRFKSRHALKSPPHITLIPPFWWDERSYEALDVSLTSLAQTEQSFDVVLQDFGAFNPRVIFIDVPEPQELNNLRDRLLSHLENSLPFKARSRTRYNPHMTIAFKDLGKGAFYRAWEYFQHQSFAGHFTVDALILFRHKDGVWNMDKTFAFGLL